MLRSRRHIGSHPPDWALSADGIRSLRGQAADGAEDIPTTDGKETSGPEPRIEDVAAAELGLKEHDRLTLAQQMMERRLVGRRVFFKPSGTTRTRHCPGAGLRRDDCPGPEDHAAGGAAGR